MKPECLIFALHRITRQLHREEIVLLTELAHPYLPRCSPRDLMRQIDAAPTGDQEAALWSTECVNGFWEISRERIGKPSEVVYAQLAERRPLPASADRSLPS